jgi:hypothetical protein
MVELLGLAGSISFLAGWRIYFCICVTGIAMRSGLLAFPHNSLDVFANPWVIGVSAVGMVAEFLADKVAWVDSIWDAVHTLIRPVAGALLALAIVDARDPVWQVVCLLLGGGAALLGHGVKAGTRAVVNTSPEPFSNAAASVGEDVVTAGLVYLVFAHPAVAIVVAVGLIAGAVVAVVALRHVMRRLAASYRTLRTSG